MFTQIAYNQTLGISFLALVGILTLFFLLFAATIAILDKKGIKVFSPKCHVRMAIITIILALIHGFLWLATVLNF